MIESGDINDGTILTATAQRTDARGFFRFVIKLPSGKDLCSEWIAPDHKKEALRKWIEVARGAIVEDATALRRAKAVPSTPASTGTEPSSASGMQNTATAAADSTLRVVSDPLEMAQKMHALLDAQVKDLYIKRENVRVDLAKAEHERDRWAKVLTILQETT